MSLIPPKLPSTVCILVFPEFQILDATGPASAFEIASREGAAPVPYEIRLVSLRGGPIRSSSGLIVDTQPLPNSGFDTLMVSGGQGTFGAATCKDTLAFVRQALQQCRRICSVCSGSYVLAAAGLLDGKRATTHWERARDLQRRFPAVTVEPDCIYVREGRIWTSAGVTAGIDLALALVAEDHGHTVAKRAAKQLVVFHRRPGGQSQYSALLELEGKTDRIGKALSFAREHLREPLSVEQLAAQACLSPRQFARSFSEETGQTPAKAVEQLRVEAARLEVEAGRLTLEQVAESVGFKDPERMRRAFLRAFGSPPQALRRSANSTEAVGT
jgi:transcriptional regulator GlxA family with amidase domain